MKRKIVMGVVLLLVGSLLLNACAAGISQEDYNAVIRERDTVQARNEMLEAKMTGAADYAEFLAAFYTREEEVEVVSLVERLDDGDLSAIFSAGLSYAMEEGLSDQEFVMRSLIFEEEISAYVADKILALLRTK